MKHTLTRAAAIAAAACISAGALSACEMNSLDTGSSQQAGSSKVGSSQGAKGGHCSPNQDYTETPVNEALFGNEGNEKDLIVADGAVHIRAVYFQPGQMMTGSKMLNYADSAAHLEVDTGMTAEGAKMYGYAEDETPTNLHIGYKIRKKGDASPILSGELMEMNAGDGSHYGTNLPVGVMTDGEYQIQFTVAPPKLPEYPLHKDNVTGVPADNWWKAEPTEWIDWNYVTPKKDNAPVEDCDVPAYQPVQGDVIPSGDPDKQAVMKMVDGKQFGCEEPEIDIADVHAAPFSFGLAYFQPGGMLEQWLTGNSAMPAYQDSIAHLEADVHVTDKFSKGVIGDKGTDYGYTDGETPAHLQINYEILTKDGKPVDSGKFMEMNADDGSHYGTNLRRTIGLKPGNDYVIRLHVSHPTDYSLHIDRKTGVKVRHWFKPFTIETPWHYTGNQLKCIVNDPNWAQAFPQPVPGFKG